MDAFGASEVNSLLPGLDSSLGGSSVTPSHFPFVWIIVYAKQLANPVEQPVPDE
jgi:hypothetical protein